MLVSDLLLLFDGKENYNKLIPIITIEQCKQSTKWSQHPSYTDYWAFYNFIFFLIVLWQPKGTNYKVVSVHLFPSYLLLCEYGEQWNIFHCIVHSSWITVAIGHHTPTSYDFLDFFTIRWCMNQFNVPWLFHWVLATSNQYSYSVILSIKAYADGK